MRGRDSLKDHALWKWADEGEQWLRDQFTGKGLWFHTQALIEERAIKLEVYKNPTDRTGAGVKIFEVTEPAVSFVSHATVTKIILIAG